MEKNIPSKAAALKTTAAEKVAEAEKFGADKVDGIKLDIGAKSEKSGAKKSDGIKLDTGSFYEYSNDGMNWLELKLSGEGYADLSSLTQGIQLDPPPPELLIRIDKSYIFAARDIELATIATVNSIHITGLGGVAINPSSNIMIKIVKGNKFAAVSVGADVSSWFKNMPAGLKAKIASCYVGGTKVSIAISGTTTTLCDHAMQIVIPGAALETRSNVTVQHNPNARFNIYMIN